MAVAITAYEEGHVPAVKAFNARLTAASVSYQFPERATSAWLPPREGRRIYEQYYVAVEQVGTVRGAFILKRQEFTVAGQTTTAAHFDLPIAEGLIDKAYNMVGVQMLMQALKLQPLLFSLGMGGFDEPLAQLLRRAGWTLRAVPFYFRVHHGSTVLRNIAAFRGTALRRAAASLAAVTGLGSLAFAAVHGWRTEPSLRQIPAQIDLVESFDDWADRIWETCKSEYALCAVRNRETLNVLYSPGNREFIRLQVSDRSGPIGWAVVISTEMRQSKHFGNMRLGTIVDCLALKANAARVIRAATQELERRGVDLIVSNQADQSWEAALEANGFLAGPSNYILALSKPLAEKLAPMDANQGRVHMTRGDGAGPINL
jgi:hypothetical protein